MKSKFCIISIFLTILLFSSFAQNKSFNTNNETYKTTGYPKVERSATVKKEFLKSKGFDKVPEGYQVDHIIPLSQGGKDEPQNMQLIPTELHKTKTANERKYNSTKTINSYPTYNSNSTYNNSNLFSSPSYNNNSGRTIHTGARGGQYYINSNGNKTYIKK